MLISDRSMCGQKREEDGKVSGDLSFRCTDYKCRLVGVARVK